jgi:hypothetical protein
MFYHRSGGASNASRGRVESSASRSPWIRPVFVLISVVLVQSLSITVVIVVDGYCCDALVLLALISMATSLLFTITVSITISFMWL